MKQKSFQSQKKSNSSEPKIFRQALEPGYERSTITVTSNASGVVAQTIAVSPSGLISAGRLAGYVALRDQIRINRVRVNIHPTQGADTEGISVLYIDRDPAAATVGSVSLALDQFERSSGAAWADYSLTWKPQQPTDHNYNLLNPGTVTLANIYLLGSYFPSSTLVMDVSVEVWFTLRGRP